MILYVILYLACTVSGLLLIKLGGANTYVAIKGNALNINLNLFIILGLIVYIISFILWIFILKSQDLSYIVPLTTGASYILIMVCSALILNEKITVMKGIGGAVLLVGIILINLGK